MNDKKSKNSVVISLKKKSNKIYNFPPISRKFIICYIYSKIINRKPSDYRDFVKSLIFDLKFNNQEKKWLKLIPNLELDEILSKLNDDIFKKPLRNYFYEFTLIIHKLEIINGLNKKSQRTLNLKNFIHEIKTTENIDTSRYFIEDVLSNLRENFVRFNLGKSTQQTLYKDQNTKECGNCHKLKSHSDFNKTKRYLRSLCKECEKYQRNLKDYRIKFEIIKKNFNSKCLECNTSMEKLPTLEFHHKDPTIKTKSWRELRGRSYNTILDYLKKEKIQVLCRNCHILTTATVFRDFNDVIIDKTFYQFSSEEKEQKITQAIKNYINTKSISLVDKDYIPRLKYRIKKWFKKRIIIENLYKGGCIGCGEINVLNNLPALSFHHKFENQKEKMIKWDKISKNTVKEIINILINENCVCLCANCHMLIHSTSFIRNVKEIFDEPSQLKIQLDYKEILLRIRNFKF